MDTEEPVLSLPEFSEACQTISSIRSSGTLFAKSGDQCTEESDEIHASSAKIQKFRLFARSPPTIPGHQCRSVTNCHCNITGKDREHHPKRCISNGVEKNFASGVPLPNALLYLHLHRQPGKKVRSGYRRR